MHKHRLLAQNICVATSQWIYMELFNGGKPKYGAFSMLQLLNSTYYINTLTIKVNANNITKAYRSIQPKPQPIVLLTFLQTNTLYTRFNIHYQYTRCLFKITPAN
jgi:hypothetical protein